MTEVEYTIPAATPATTPATTPAATRVCPRCMSPVLADSTSHGREACDGVLWSLPDERRRTLALERIADALDATLSPMPGGPAISVVVLGTVETEPSR